VSKRKTRAYVSASVKIELGRPTCPNCGTLVRGAAGVTLHQAPKELPTPKGGDVSVCAHCGEILEYRRDLMVARIAPATFDSLPAHQRRLLSEMSMMARQHPMPGPSK
jgi:hypothetical protein